MKLAFIISGSSLVEFNIACVKCEPRPNIDASSSAIKICKNGFLRSGYYEPAI